MNIRNRVVVLAGLCSALMGGTAFGALGGAATVTPIAGPGAGNWTYAVSLSNTGTTPIGTLWFGWIPGQNYLFSSPASIVSPAGWSASVVGGGSNFSVLWTASGTATDVDAGGSLSGFSFISTMNPTQMAGNSPNFGVPVTTSYFYSGGAFSDAGFRFIAAVVPAPGVTVMGVAGLMLCTRRRR